jgi:RNA polymerase sigma factor for flagellar operon FliA
MTQVLTPKTAAQNVTAPMDPVLLETYLPLVKKVVYGMGRHLPSHVDLEDLQSVGIMGLISAVRRYDPSQGNTFEAYALLRIRGAILDELRRLDRMPRTARAKARKLQEVTQVLEQKFGRKPEENEVQSALGLNGREFNRMIRQTQPITFLSLDSPQSTNDGQEVDLHDAIPDENLKPIGNKVSTDELIHVLKDKIELLPERQKQVLALLYHEEMRLCEVASIFKVTEARICQIRNQALHNLRNFMQSVLQE